MTKVRAIESDGEHHSAKKDNHAKFLGWTSEGEGTLVRTQLRNGRKIYLSRNKVNDFQEWLMGRFDLSESARGYRTERGSAGC